MVTQSERDNDIIAHILKYCKRIENYLIKIENNYAIFMSEDLYRDAISMCELQIGELSNHLSDEFKEQHKTVIPWSKIRAFRNILAHNYYNSDNEILWKVATVDVPAVRKFCEDVLNTNKNP